MKKTFALIKREYLQTVKTKGFLIGTLLMPILMILLILLPVMFSHINVETKSTIMVIDQTGRVFGNFSTALAETRKNDRGESLYDVQEIKVDLDQLGAKKKELEEQVLNDKIQAYIVIPDSIFTSNKFEIYSKNITNFDFFSRVERTLTSVMSDIRLQESGLDPGKVDAMTHWVNAQTFKVDKTGSEESSGEKAFLFSYIMVFILYFALLMYGQYILRGVIEDKNSRVVEVVISSVKPYQLMAGKVIGLGATGLTQFFIWILTFGLVSTYGLVLVQMVNPGVESLPLPDLGLGIYAAFIIFFLLGYFLYATMFAALGSMVNTESEAQNLQWPLMMLIIVAFMAMFAIIRTPDSTLAVVLSLIPFFTPLLMFLRVTLGAAPLYQVLLSIVITAGSIVGLLWVSGKIFRVGILMYGKKPTLPEVMKWIKY